MFQKIYKKNIPFILSQSRKNTRVFTHLISGKYMAITFLIIFAFSCKKEDSISNSAEKIQWIRVLEDSITYSTDDEKYLGTNGKVITDPDDNIYTYYYSKNLDQAIVSKYDPLGTPVWKKTFDNCRPLDMVLRIDGSLLLAASLTGTVPNFLTLYSIQTNGSIETKNDTIRDFFFSCAEVLNANIFSMPDNSFIISGVWNSFISGASFSGTDVRLFIVKHSQLQIREWSQLFGFCFTCPYTVTLPGGGPAGASSVAPTNNGQYVFQFDFNGDSNYPSTGRSILTGILNTNGSADTSFIFNTGLYNRYGNGFIQDYGGDYIFHYSSPTVFGNASQSVPAGFLRIGQDALIQDTVPIPIPNDHRIASFTKGTSGFMATAYKGGVSGGGSDFSAAHTMFLRGGSDWRVTEKFTLQQFYSDYFFSNAPTSEGGFISMGRIQSFNGPVNKLVLVKWKN
jgi:hypothetical protein